MATTLYSASLRLALPTTGDLFGTWGTEINNSITQMVDQAIAGRAVVSMTSDANYTLTALNGTSDEARCAVLKVTSSVSLTAQRNVVCPVVPKLYIVENATTGGQAIQIIGATGTGVVIPSGRTYRVRCDGTNVVLADGDSVNGLGGAAFPSYTFSGDTNTGMWSPGADQIAWSTGGTQRATVDSSGRWGFNSAAVSTAQVYTAASFTNTASSEYGNYTLATAANTSGAVSKIGVTGVSRAIAGYAGTGAVVGVLGAAELTAAVTAPLLYAVQGAVNTSAAGTITTATGFTTAVTNSGGAAVTNLIGYLASDMTVGTGTLIAGFYGNVTTGTGKWNLYVPGSARSYHAGRFLIGTATENTSGAKLQVSDGITFPATAVASTDANTLDDYEEGTWTPTAVGASVAGSGTYAIQLGYYTKIGRNVFVNGYVSWTGHTGSGDLRIGAFPFAMSTDPGDSWWGSPNLGGSLTYPAGTVPQIYSLGGGGVLAAVNYTQSGGGGAVALATLGIVQFSFMYRATS